MRTRARVFTVEYRVSIWVLFERVLERTARVLFASRPLPSPLLLRSSGREEDRIQCLDKPSRSRGFTLIELIAIIAVLAIAVLLVVPRLSDFFRGRKLDSEARQLLALMHHGHSRAVSEGVPMILWIDPKARTYGLQEEPGYSDKDPEAVDFTLEESLQFELPESTAPTAPLNTTTPENAVHPGTPQIRFLPDGSIAETSPKSVRLLSADGAAFTLVQSRDRVQYEIQSTNN